MSALADSTQEMCVYASSRVSGLARRWLPQPLISFASRVFVVGKDIETVRPHQLDDLPPEILRGTVEKHPVVATQRSRIPVLARAELEQIFAVSIHAEKLHQFGFVPIPVDRVGDSRLFALAVDDSIGHLFPPE